MKDAPFDRAHVGQMLAHTESDDFRTGLRLGARLVFEHLALEVPSSLKLEAQDWLEELDRWNDGPFPAPPTEWPKYDFEREDE